MRLGKAMLVMTLPAAGIGIVVGLALRSAAPSGPAPGETPASGGETAPPGPANGDGGERPSRGERPHERRPRVRAGQPAAVQVDPGVAQRLSDADANVRYAAALELLQAGTPAIGVIDHVEPPTPEGRALRDLVVNQLTKLQKIEEGEGWERMPEAAKRELLLTTYRAVVPEAYLRPERRDYWRMRVAGDAVRLAKGRISDGEAAWNRLELALVRHELGEILDADWKKEREASLPAARTWVASAKTRTDVPPARVRELEARLAQFEK